MSASVGSPHGPHREEIRGRGVHRVRRAEACLFSGRSGHKIFFRSCRSPACSNVFQSKQHAAGHSAGAMCSRGPRGGVISDNSREKRPKSRTARPLPDRGVGIMTMSEYEEQFRSPTPSLHQTFAEARGPNRGRRRSRPFWVAAALVGVMSMTMNVMSHHTVHSAASNRLQLCESGIR